MASQPVLPQPSQSVSVVISHVAPVVEGGRYPAKRVVGEALIVEADIFKDGHDVIAAVMQWRRKGRRKWHEVPMGFVDNDRWTGRCQFEESGDYEFTIEAWSDGFLTWRHDFERRLQGGQEQFETEIEEGRQVLLASAKRARGKRRSADARALEAVADAFGTHSAQAIVDQAHDPEVEALAARWTDRSGSAQAPAHYPLVVERPLARFSAWYEFFPRSASGSGTRHSTFKDCLSRIEDVRDMGFDIVYFPPIHPIGLSHRKGRNNTLNAEPGDVGSPWAIGSAEGGHQSIEPALGTLEDFRKLVRKARKLGVEIALDFAINCSPDHPYVAEHPEWFFHRPDGTIKYAENPPKKYQDIYPLNFHCEDWRRLWAEMVRVVSFWIDQGVEVFRVDNPHTKPVAFWEYLITEIHRKHPDVIFLSEAFTRPKMMQTLAKAGFTQSYTYFTWRVEKGEIIDYVEELTQDHMRDYYRANFWPNTPDILPFHLQGAPPAAFKLRAALAATLTTSWGIYSGYELCENEPLPGREEYLDSEKYQLKERDWDAPGNIKPFLTRLNEIRRQQPALQEYANIRFAGTENSRLLAYVKYTDDLSNVVIVVVNLDPDHVQAGLVDLPLKFLGLEQNASYTVEDLMYEESYVWQGPSNYVELNPRSKPAHIFRLVR